MRLTRRDVLRALAASAALPVYSSGAPVRRRTVGIVGSGMAGVSLAWLLDGACDVVLLEAQDSIGGNVRSIEVEVDGRRIVVDMGAQYFHPAPYPTYTALLDHLGLRNPGSSTASATSPFSASITLTAGVQSTPQVRLAGAAGTLVALHRAVEFRRPAGVRDRLLRRQESRRPGPVLGRHLG